MYRHTGSAFHKDKWISWPGRRTWLWLLTGWMHRPPLQITGVQNTTYFFSVALALHPGCSQLQTSQGWAVQRWACALALASVSLCTHFQNEETISVFCRAYGMPNKDGTERRCSKQVSVDSEYPTSSSSRSKAPSKLWQTWLWILHFSTHHF